MVVTPPSGALRLLGLLTALRFFVLAMTAAPVTLVAIWGIHRGVGHRPYLTDIEGRLPIFHALRLLQATSPSLIVVAVVAAVGAVVVSQLLNAGAVERLSRPPRDREGFLSAAAGILTHGLSHRRLLMKVLLGEVCLIAGGALALAAALQAWVVHGHQVGWTAWATWGVGPAAQGALGLCWVALVGALGHWCRVVAVMDDHSGVRRALRRVARVWRRHVLSAPALFVVVTLLVQVGSGAALAAWRQWPPSSAAGLAPVVGGWCVVTLGHAAAWAALTWAAVRLVTQTSRRQGVAHRP